MWGQAREQFNPCLFFMHLENHMTVRTEYGPGEVRRELSQGRERAKGPHTGNRRAG